MLAAHTTKQGVSTAAGTQHVKKTITYEQFYDKHLDERLVVKRVVLKKGLLECIAGMWEEYAQKLIDNDQIPTRAPIIRNPDAIEMLNMELDRGMEIFNEFSVSERHFLGASCLFPPIASALVLHPTNWERSLITWARDVRWKKRFIVDGALQFPLELRHSRLQSSSVFKPAQDSMNVELKGLLPRLATSYNPLAVWNFENLSMDDNTAMEEIIEMGKGISQFVNS